VLVSIEEDVFSAKSMKRPGLQAALDTDLERQGLSLKPEVEYKLVSSYDYFGFEPTNLGWDDLVPEIPRGWESYWDPTATFETANGW
jgi:hypothetical protein